MAWTWILLGADGSPTDAGAQLLVDENSANGQRISFDSQGDAESFIGETWRELLAAGVDSVQLFEDDRLVYSMSLQPPTV